jgi:hypothetical protein
MFHFEATPVSHHSFLIQCSVVIALSRCFRKFDIILVHVLLFTVTESVPFFHTKMRAIFFCSLALLCVASVADGQVKGFEVMWLIHCCCYNNGRSCNVVSQVLGLYYVGKSWLSDLLTELETPPYTVITEGDVSFRFIHLLDFVFTFGLYKGLWRTSISWKKMALHKFLIDGGTSSIHVLPAFRLLTRS